MKPLTDENKFPKFAVFDIEASKWVNLRCLCHVDEDDVDKKTGEVTPGQRKHFKSAEAYVDWLFDEWEGGYVWAHWGGHYDHRFVLHEVHRRAEAHLAETGEQLLDFELVISGNLIIILAVKLPDGREIKFCESARLMPDSVENVGKAIGLPKLDCDVTEIDSKPWAELLTYCYRDCDIVLRALVALRETLQGEGVDFAHTLASMATRYIRRSDVLDFRKFYENDPDRPGKLKPDRLFWDADTFSCAAYFGGRTEAFAVGKFDGPFWLYDIRSSYPASMLHGLPCYFKEFRAGPIRGHSVRQQLLCCAITQAEVNIPRGSMPYPLLPIRITRFEQSMIEGEARAFNRCLLCGVPNTTEERAADWLCPICAADPVPMTGGKVLFVEGRFEGRWTNIELLALYDHMKDVPGFEIKVKCQAVYEPRAFLKPFVEKFWRLRQRALADEASDDPTTAANGKFRAYVFKIWMNAVSGKLAEQVTKTKVVYGKEALKARRKYGGRDSEKKPEKGRVQPTSVPGIWIIEHESEGAFRHAAAAAYVTGRSRIWLWQAFMRAHEQGARVMYSDTDSIIVDKPIFGEDKRSGLGEWNFEHKIKHLEIFAPKVYRFETYEPDKRGRTVHYKAKGMPIERRQDQDQPQTIEERWQLYTQRFQSPEDARKRLGYVPKGKPSKEGIRGLMSDLNDLRSTTAAPRAFTLERQLNNTDKKRRHRQGYSDPLYQVRTHAKQLRKLGRLPATGPNREGADKRFRRTRLSDQ